MNKLILTTFLLFHLCAYSQQCPPVNNTECNEPETDPDSPLRYNDMVHGVDFDGEYAVRGLKLGGGMTYGLFSSAFGIPGHVPALGYSRDGSWNYNQAGGFLEIMYELKTSRKISIGFSTSWNTLLKQKESFEKGPPFPAAEEEQPFPFQGETPSASPTLYAARWSVEKAFKQNNFLLFSEIQVYQLSKRFDLFVRPEIGLSNFRYQFTINAQDSCHCDQEVFRINNPKTTVTGGLGFGLNWNLHAVEFKSMIGYRLYDAVGSISRDDFSRWNAELDAESFDFRGGRPRADNFKINTPNDNPKIGRKTGVLYFQIGMYLNFGEMLNY